MFKKCQFLIGFVFVLSISISLDLSAGKLFKKGCLSGPYIHQLSNFYTKKKRPMRPLERGEFIALVESGGFDVEQAAELTVLMLAVQAGDLETVRFLLSRMKNINSPQGLDPHAGLNLRDPHGRTALMLAARRGLDDIVLMLLMAGADHKATDFAGSTALIEAHAYAQESSKKTSAVILGYWDEISGAQTLNQFLAAKSKILIDLEQKSLPPSLEQFLRERGAVFFVEDRLKSMRTSGPALVFNDIDTSSAKCFYCQGDFFNPDGLIEKGPGGCACFICSECKPDFARLELENCSSVKLNCPSCDMMLDPDFFKQVGCSKRDVFKISKAIVDRELSHRPGWVYCRTPDCPAGKIVAESQSAYYSCPLCVFKGCLKCGKDHARDCNQTRDDEDATNKHLKSLLEQGRFPPPLRGHPANPKDPAYYLGRYRPCYYCGIMTERPLNGRHESGQCNGMKCGNPQCKKNWHWNYGDHRDHPANRRLGQSEIHDYNLEYQQYKPRQQPRF